MRANRSEKGPVSVLGRSMVVLNAFDFADTFLTVGELCRRTRLPKSTAHRAVSELVAWGMLERVTGGVQLGMRMFELGQMAPKQRRIVDAAKSLLIELSISTGQTVHLAVLAGSEVVYIDKLEGNRGPALESRIGRRMPAYCTALGKALLAFSPSAATDAVLHSPLIRRTARTVVAPGLLVRDLNAVAQTGISHEHEESSTGVACVSVPVLDGSGRALAAVSVSGWAHRLDASRLASTVRTAGLGIGRTLQQAVVV
jgi:IclR family acetate operon transcriptional repressor